MQTWNIFVSYLWSQPCNVNEISNFCTYINIHMSYIFSVLYFLSIFLRCVLVAVAASPIFGGNTVSLPIEIFYFDWISIGFSVIISFKIGKKTFHACPLSNAIFATSNYHPKCNKKMRGKNTWFLRYVIVEGIFFLITAEFLCKYSNSAIASPAHIPHDIQICIWCLHFFFKKLNIFPQKHFQNISHNI